ncbi:MAG TPA: toll/interleukin-1 receptor domain-containing protein [Bryobacteraceae bacterium]|nr:toll/interleukin-1 receptor domain-containing protein [Bryobacteraceae bacterium]
MTIEELSHLIRHSLDRARAVEIDGLGVFARNRTGDISFQYANQPRIFIAYATEDRLAAERVFRELTAHGFAAWLDCRKLLPGQNWPRRIEDAIASSDFFIACFSTRSVKKRGGFQAEIRYALDCASRVPLDDVFLIPVRLDDCRVPARIQRETQYVDLFPDWAAGFKRVLRIIDHQLARRAA